jgi:hypothetical protein
MLSFKMQGGRGGVGAQHSICGDVDNVACSMQQMCDNVETERAGGTCINVLAGTHQNSPCAPAPWRLSVRTSN